MTLGGRRYHEIVDFERPVANARQKKFYWRTVTLIHK